MWSCRSEAVWACLQVIGGGTNGWAPPLNGSSTSHGIAVGGPAVSSSSSWGGQGNGDVQRLREQVWQQMTHLKPA